MNRMKKIFTLLKGLLRSVSKVGNKIVPEETMRMLNRIAEEGYETASDILFPKEEAKEESLHYGPVLPG
jgi:hypothetical protein